MSECTQCEVSKMKRLFSGKKIKNSNLSIKSVIFAYRFIKVRLSNGKDIPFDVKLGAKEINNQINQLIENGFTN